MFTISVVQNIVKLVLLLFALTANRPSSSSWSTVLALVMCEEKWDSCYSVLVLQLDAADTFSSISYSLFSFWRKSKTPVGLVKKLCIPGNRATMVTPTDFKPAVFSMFLGASKSWRSSDTDVSGWNRFLHLSIARLPTARQIRQSSTNFRHADFSDEIRDSSKLMHAVILNINLPCSNVIWTDALVSKTVIKSDSEDVCQVYCRNKNQNQPNWPENVDEEGSPYVSSS